MSRRPRTETGASSQTDHGRSHKGIERAAARAAEGDQEEDVWTVGRGHASDPISLLRSVVTHFLAFFLCLLAAHYIMTYEIETIRPSRMNLVYMAFAVLFGFDFHVRVGAGTAVSIVAGFCAGLTSALAMSVAVWFISESPLLAGRQERIDLMITASAIMLAYAGGSAFAALLRQLVPVAFRAGNGESVQTIRALLTSISPAFGKTAVARIKVLKSLIHALTTVILAAGAMWVAFKSLF